jgi:membrane protease YdiL (CAAX protease family)
MSEATMKAPSATQIGPIRGWFEVLAIPMLIPIGGILGSLTGFAPLVPICSVGLPLLVATLFLHLEGTSWRSLAFGRAIGIKQLLGFAALATVASFAAVSVTVMILQQGFGLPLIDVSAFESAIKGNLTAYLWFLIPVAWGSAAIGEELLVRGYLLHRIEGLAGLKIAIVLQAIIFSSAHLYQGITSVFSIFVLSLVFGAVYLKSGRNLVTVIIAHGCIDTLALTLIYFGRADLLIGT